MLMNGQITSLNVGFPLADINTAAQDKKAENVASFKDFLSNVGVKADDIAKNSYVHGANLRKNEKTDISTANENVKHKTFKELEKGMKAETRKAMIQAKKEPVADNDAESEVENTGNDISNSQKADIMLNCMAQVMGVKVEDLVKLLESAGIKPEELSSVSESDTLETKLAQAFGVDEKMGGTLVKILKMIDTQVDDAISKLLQDGNTVKDQQVVQDDMKLKPVLAEEISSSAYVGDADSTGISGLMMKLKLKIKEMGEKLEKNDTALVQEISFKIQPVLKNASTVHKLAVNQFGIDELANAGSEVGENMEAETTDAKESGSVHSENRSDKAVDSNAIMPQQTLSKPEMQETAQAFGNVINQLQSKEPEANVDNLKLKSPVTGKEILNQVIEKAKVVLTAEKSEMIIDLKSDSLGKLSLKVVTEQGIVMAKFVAESQQVKQVLETNMQLLKDSMEKQGLNVQGFSVSVRQESQGNRSGYNNHEDDSRRVSTLQMPGSNRIYADAAHIERLQRVNPYKQDGNTINLTA